MMNVVSILTTIYLFPVAVIMAIYFAIYHYENFDYDDDSVSEFLDTHLDENLFGYFVVQTLFYVWIYIIFFM